ncbi:uncharacterized protein LOC127850546 [Dreissena polymorpha]|uniref:Cystatin domain-containing protein n=1 Tax=Dreissena polymorpha TaxID=45954 RepID=A0A9D4HWC2_DREPO|nr:uncharacterized protein LOC127850546 [Dreissena polymorpha]KAH3733466.1 hypothetical protein DPMN_039894 [Dreissena polymorpha]
MASQKTLLLLVVLVSAAFAARQRQLGAWYPVPNNDKTVLRIAKFAAGQICSSYVVDAVVQAEEQVVAGTNYRMDILVSKTWKCEVEVFEQIWTKTQRLTSFACKSVL